MGCARPGDIFWGQESMGLGKRRAETTWHSMTGPFLTDSGSRMYIKRDDSIGEGLIPGNKGDGVLRKLGNERQKPICSMSRQTA